MVQPKKATDDNVVRRMHFACRIHTATETHSEYLILIAFHCNNGYTKAPKQYFIRTLSVLFLLCESYKTRK